MKSPREWNVCLGSVKVKKAEQIMPVRGEQIYTLSAGCLSFSEQQEEINDIVTTLMML